MKKLPQTLGNKPTLGQLSPKSRPIMVDLGAVKKFSKSAAEVVLAQGNRGIGTRTSHLGLHLEPPAGEGGPLRGVGS